MANITWDGVIAALDELIKNRVNSAAYSRIIGGTITEVVDTDKKQYNVTLDGGVTTVAATAIDGTSEFKQKDLVYLLYLNEADKATYHILSTQTSDGKEVVDEFNSKVVEQSSHTFESANFDEGNYNGENGQELDLTSTTIIADINLYGSMRVSGKFTAPIGATAATNYGFTLALYDEGSNKIGAYTFDTYKMTGQPWLFNQAHQSFSIDLTQEEQKKLKKIKLFGIAGIGINELTIGATVNVDPHVYSAAFQGGSDKVDYITTKEAGKASIDLKAIFYKDGRQFNSNLLKYYWFKLNPAITGPSVAGYHPYGKENWELLNPVDSFTTVNGTKIDKVKNLGNIYTITAKQNEGGIYTSQYKCVIEYGINLLYIPPKKILNLDAANKYSLSITGTVNGSGSGSTCYLKEITDTTEVKFDAVATPAISGYSGITYIWSYQKDSDKDSTVISGQTSATLTLNKTSSPSLDSLLGNEKTTFYCVVAAKVSGKNVAIVENKIDLYKDAIVLTDEVWYCGSDNSTPPAANDSGWTLTSSDINKPYIFAKKRQVNKNSSGVYVYTGPFGDIYCHKVANASDDKYAEMVTTFNSLTRNGADQGIYYGERYFVTTDTTKESGKTYYTRDSGGEYEVFNGAAFSSGVTYYEKDGSGNLYINASLIKTGVLDANIVTVTNLNASNITSGTIDASTVDVTNLNASNITSGSIEVKNNSGETVFKADKDNKEVQLSGFSVTENQLSSEDSTVGLIAQKGNNAGMFIWAGNGGYGPSSAPFRVLGDGTVIATNANISGNITADKGGTIGGFTIDASNTSLKSNDGMVGLRPGSSDTDVCIWAGATNNNIDSAPFRVQKDGAVYSTSYGQFGLLQYKENNISWLSDGAGAKPCVLVEVPYTLNEIDLKKTIFTINPSLEDKPGVGVSGYFTCLPNKNRIFEITDNRTWIQYGLNQMYGWHNTTNGGTNSYHNLVGLGINTGSGTAMSGTPTTALIRHDGIYFTANNTDISDTPTPCLYKFSWEKLKNLGAEPILDEEINDNFTY